MNNVKYSEKRRFGNVGEDIVCKHLERAGYKIVERNYLKKWGELDIVALKGDIIHFIEVKTVSRDTSKPKIPNSFRPEESVHKNKLARLKRVIQSYILERRIEDRVWEFSVAVLFLDKKHKKARVTHLKNIIIE